MKTIVLLALYFPFLFVAEQQDRKVDPQVQFARNVFNNIAQKNYGIASDKYLDQKGFEDLAAHLDEKPDQSVIDREIQKYDEKKQRFVKEFNERFSALSLETEGCSSIVWEKAKVDSVNYDYIIGKPKLQDVEILWPESQKYVPSENEFLCNRSRIYFSDGEHAYAMQIESLYYNKTWWFFHKTKSPRLMKLK